MTSACGPYNSGGSATLHILVDCILTSISKVQQVGKLDGFHIVLKWKAELCIVVLENYGNNLVQAKDNNANGINEMAPMFVGYHSIMWKQAYLAHDKWDMSWWFWIGLYNGLLCMNKKS
jgi:hypothetical protein